MGTMVAAPPTAEDGASAEIGRVRIARRVLRTVVREAALSVPGVARLATAPSAWTAILRRPRPRDGVALAVHRDVVGVDLHVVIEPDLSMVAIGEAIQERVAAAVEHILGMRVSAINVYIRDVA